MSFLWKFHSKNFLKIQEFASVDDSEGKKRLHGVWTAWFIVKWFTVAKQINEVALSLFSELGISSQDQFCQ